MSARVFAAKSRNLVLPDPLSRSLVLVCALRRCLRVNITVHQLAGVLSEARPVEATRPARLACGFEATPGGGAFYGKNFSFDALSLTARSSFDSFDASCL